MINEQWQMPHLTHQPVDQLTDKPLAQVTKILTLLALAVFILYLVIYCVYALALFQFPYDYDQGEGFELNDSLLFSQGQWPYRSDEVYPFYSSNYPPLFHLLVIPLFAIFGPTLTAGRVLSFAATLLIAALVGWVVHSKTRDGPIAAISGLMVLASNFIYHVGPLFRQHMLMVLFELLAVIAITHYDDPKHGKRNVVLAMLALLAAGYTKQLSVATVAAVLAFLLLRSPRKSIVAGLGLAVVAGGIFVWMNVATDGQWFLNTITANANAYDYRQALQLYGQFFSLHFWIAALAIGYSVYELYWDRLSAYTVWFVFAFANSALSGKWGAGESYFATAVVAACVLSGLAIGKIKEHLPQRFPRMAMIVGVLIPLLYLAQAWGVRHLPTDGPVFGTVADLMGVGRGASVYAGYPYYDAIGYTQVGHLPTDDDTVAGDKIAQMIRASNLPALTEEAMLALRAGQPVVTNPTQLLNLWNSDALDPTELIAAIDRQAFGLVVFRAQFYPPPVLQAIGARYAPVTDVTMNGFQYRILAPRRDYGAGCDEARFYGSIARIKTLAPVGGFIRIASRDTRPTGWAGPSGVSELDYRVGDPKTSRKPIYQLWIAPLNWQGQPPANGSGATRLGQNQCFQFFDAVDDAQGVWPNARASIVETLGIMP